MKKRSSSSKLEINYPAYCDFTCSFGSFGNPESSGACRREITVWCTKLKAFNNKNNPCLNRKK